MWLLADDVDGQQDDLSHGISGQIMFNGSVRRSNCNLPDSIEINKPQNRLVKTRKGSNCSFGIRLPRQVNGLCHDVFGLSLEEVRLGVR